MKNIRTIAFFLVMALYLWFPYSMIADQQRILKKGELFRFVPRPVDPYDAFRGRFIYLNLNTNFDYPKANEAFSYGETVYLSIEKDDQGYASFTNPSKTAPASGYFIKTKVSSAYDNTLWVQVPENLERYYLNEKLAPLAEQKFNELTRNQDSVKVFLDARVLDGEVLIEELYFEGKTVSDYLKNL